MKQERFQSRDEWMFARRGKITGSRLKDVYSKRDPEKKKIGYYELIAEMLGLPPDTDETAMERGSRLESMAIDTFTEKTGKVVDKSLIMWMRDDDESIAISPDGIVVPKCEHHKGYAEITGCAYCNQLQPDLASPKEAVEAKCLSSARHIEAFLTGKIPDEYHEQAVQYFVVNDALELLHFVFYDPRFEVFRDPESKQTKLDYFTIDVKRADVQPEVEKFLPHERKLMAEAREVVNKLTF